MLINPYIYGVSYDTDAQAFITATGITDTTQINAINTLVLDLKSYGIWSKMKALYPFVGGTATTHKYNLKDPRDLDVAFRLQFVNGWTHSSNGVVPNGTDAYADTKLSPTTTLTSNNHFSFYNNGTSSNAETSIDIGCGDGNITYSAELYLWTYREDNTMKYDNCSSSNNRVSSTTTSNGFSVGSRISNTSQKIYKNGTLLANNSNVNVTQLPYQPTYIGAGNINGASQFYSTKRSSFASIGDGLTDTEVTNLYTAIQAYQTTLGRQV